MRDHLRPHSFEPGEDELPPPPEIRFGLDRRKFFKLFGGGLAVVFAVKDMFSLSGETALLYTDPPNAEQVDAWIHIGEDGTVTVYTGKVEVGQNIRTSLSQAVAEELHAPLPSIKMIMGDTDLVPYDAGTFGSRTTPQMGTQLRRAAATARQALLDMAAKNWSVDAASLQASDGMITDPVNHKKIGYGELTKGQQLMLSVSDKVPLTPSADWKVAGQSAPKVGGRAFLTGTHQYVSDMKRPGMLYAKILRPPSFKAKLVDVDISKAQSMAGVVVVRDGDFVGVAARDITLAGKAIQSINAKWEEMPPPVTSENMFDYLVRNAKADTEGRDRGIIKGNVEEALASADHKHKKAYNISYIAHIPLEPRAALAEWTDGKLTVWAGTQRPFGVQEELAEAFKLSKNKIRVIMPDTGSGYGGKHSGEAAIEAARLAQQAKKPVKLVWTRQEEFTWAYFRPGGVIDVEAGVANDGTVSAWKFINYNSGPAGLETPYKVSNQQIDHLPSNTPLRQGSYRGLAATANVFARESHMTDLARLVGMDQLEFRLKNSTDDRFNAVLEKAAGSFGWKASSRPKGNGYGIGCAFEKGGYVAACAEVAVDSDKKVSIVRVVQAFECGAVVNPLHLESQLSGAIVQGLGGALFEAIEFANGKITNASLSEYRVPRFSDIPKIEVVIIDRKDLPSAGAGEAGIMGVAPAIRNAILDATGVALYNLPMLPNMVLP